MLSEALSWFTKVKLEAGYVVVLETAGRSAHWNPHLHILMTSGGMTPQQQWREVDYFPFTVLHKKWQYHLFTMLKQRVGTRALKAKIDVLWRKYPRGLVAYLEEGKVPAGGEGLAYYLAKYVVSPPISLRRLLSYDGQRVRYWYNDHKTKQRQEDVYRADGATYSAERVSPHPLLRTPCHVQGQEGEGGAHSVDGGAGAVDQGDLSHRSTEDLS
jgi:hypothetical protein